MESLIRFLESHPEACDRCLRGFSEEEVRRLKEAAKKYVEELRTRSNSTNLQALTEDVLPMPELPHEASVPPELRTSYRHAYESYANEIRRINTEISRKVDEPSKAVSIDFSALDEAVQEFERQNDEVTKLVLSHNQTVRTAESRRQVASAQNLHIASLENAPLLRDLLKFELENASVQLEMDQLTVKIEGKRKRLRRLKQKLQHVGIALDEINKRLHIVFGEDRLNLVPADRGYQVFSRGKPVRPEDLSTGERNILGLCYFFVATARGRSMAEHYRAQNIVVLDDPISSFDIDNKYGVMVLIVSELARYFAPSSNSLFLIMTHDLSVAYDLSKALNSITTPGLFELEQNELVERAFDDVDIYRATLSKIYHSVVERRPEGIDLMGLRRVYEAFVKFHFNAGIGDALGHNALLNHFNDVGSAERNFIDVFLASPFMNRGAHEELSILALDFYSTPPLSDDDKLKFARQALLFVHIVSPWHIAARIRDKKDEQDAVKRQLDQLLDEELTSL